MDGFSRRKAEGRRGGGAERAVRRLAASLVVGLLFSAFPPLRLSATVQRPSTVTGTVVRRAGADTLPATGARVVLHGVGRERSGPIDSALTTPSGGFRFAWSADTTVIYLISARWAGIEYFSEPLPGSSLGDPARITLLVADTSSSAALRLAGRFLVIGAPDTERNRSAVDLFVLRNPGSLTRVGADSAQPVWRHVLPSGATARAVASPGSEISPEAVRFVGDTVLVFAPLAPGDKQLLLQYRFPASLMAITVPPGDQADSVQVVTEEAEVRVQGLPAAPAQMMDGRPFARWAGASVGREPIVVAFPVTRSVERWLVPLLAAVVAAMLGLALMLRRHRTSVAPAATAPAAEVEALLDRIARLDAAHRATSRPAAEAAEYAAERARLKAALEAALAARKGAR